MFHYITVYFFFTFNKQLTVNVIHDPKIILQDEKQNEIEHSIGKNKITFISFTFYFVHTQMYQLAKITLLFKKCYIFIKLQKE